MSNNGLPGSKRKAAQVQHYSARSGLSPCIGAHYDVALILASWLLLMSCSDYERIETAIRFIRDEFRSQPSLQEIASHLGLSQYHFHRLFQRWAGTTPKRFLQYVTAAYAREQLRKSATVLEASEETGLSSSGRLHDVLVTLDAMSPGEMRRLGAGLDIQYGFHQTPFGACLIAVTSRGVCGLDFVARQPVDNALASLQQRWPGANLALAPQITQQYIDRIFSRKSATTDPVPLWVRGTNLQLKVWEALLRIPFQGLLSYQQIADQTGYPGAARAMGTAIAANPVLYLIPCHRVIRKTGIIGEYRGGSWRKQAMIAWEAAQIHETEK